MELKLKEIDKLVGFGSMKRQKFDHCGRQYEKHPNGEITISMKAHQWMFAMGNEGVTLSFSVRCENAPTEAGQA